MHRLLIELSHARRLCGCGVGIAFFWVIAAIIFVIAQLTAHGKLPIGARNRLLQRVPCAAALADLSQIVTKGNRVGYATYDVGHFSPKVQVSPELVP